MTGSHTLMIHPANHGSISWGPVVEHAFCGDINYLDVTDTIRYKVDGLVGISLSSSADLGHLRRCLISS